MFRTAAVLVLGGSLLASALPQAARVQLAVFNSGRDEYATITAAAALSLKGWTLASGVGGQKLSLGAVDLPAGTAVRVVSGTTAPLRGDIAWTRQNVWNNEGDTALLFDQSGSLVAEVNYGRTRAPSPAKASSAKGTKARR